MCFYSRYTQNNITKYRFWSALNRRHLGIRHYLIFMFRPPREGKPPSIPAPDCKITPTLSSNPDPPLLSLDQMIFCVH